MTFMHLGISPRLSLRGGCFVHWKVIAKPVKEFFDIQKHEKIVKAVKINFM